MSDNKNEFSAVPFSSNSVPAFAITKVSSDYDEDNVLSGGSIAYGLVYITGTAKPNSQVILQIEGQKTEILRADSQGNWSRLTTTGPNGEKTITATVSGPTGWVTEEHKINVVAATPQPERPVDPVLPEPELPVTPVIPIEPVVPEPELPVTPVIPIEPVVPEPELPVKPITPAPVDGSAVFAITKVASDYDEASVADGGSIRNGLVYIEGTAKPNSQVILQIEGQKTQVLRADNEGNWRLLTVTGPNGEKTITATVSGPTGWVTEEHRINVTAATPQPEIPVEAELPISPVLPVPELPTNPVTPEPASKVVITAVSNRDGTVDNNSTSSHGFLTLKGTGPANSVVNIYAEVPGFGRSVIGVATTKEDGSWNTTVSVPQGNLSLSAQAGDAISLEFNVNIDVPYNWEPKVEIVSIWSDEGQLTEGAQTEDRTPHIIGTAAPNTIVYVMVDGKMQEPVYTNSYGDWQYTPTLHDGRNEIVVISGGIQSEAFVINLPGEYVVEPLPQPEPDNAQITGVYNGRDIVDSGAISEAPLLTLTGTGAPNQPVYILDGDTIIDTVSADENGNWTSGVINLSQGDHALRVQSGNATSEAYNITVQFSPVIVPEPEAGLPVAIISILAGDDSLDTGSITTSQNLMLQGTGPANQTVMIYSGNSIIGHTSTNEEGQFEAYIDVWAGQHVLSVQIGDDSSQIWTINVETAPVSAMPPEIYSAFADEAEFGSILSGGTTGDRTPLMDGRAEPNTNLEIFVNGQLVHTTYTDINGFWQYTPTLSDGINNIHVASNGLESAGFMINLVPVIPPVESIVTLWGDDQEQISARTYTVGGTAPAGAIVTVYADDRIIGETEASSDGFWTFHTGLKNGENVLQASVDGEFSNQQIVEVTNSPRPLVTSAHDDYLQNSAIYNPGLRGDAMDDRTPQLKGYAQPDALVQVWVNNVMVGSAQADINGVWIYDATLGDGSNVIHVSEEGLTSQDFVLNIEDAPGISGIYVNGDELIPHGGDMNNSQSITARGTAQPNAEVTIVVSGGDQFTVRADDEGNWSRDITLGNGSTAIYAVANAQWSTAYEVNYIASNALAASNDEEVADQSQALPLAISGLQSDVGISGGYYPEGTTINDGTPIVFGRAEPGLLVQLFLDDQSVGSAVTDARGIWEMPITMQDGSHVLTATADGQATGEFAINVNDQSTQGSARELFAFSAQDLLSGQEDALFAPEPAATPELTLALDITTDDMLQETLNEGMAVQTQGTQYSAAELDELAMQS